MSVALVIFVATLAASLIGLYAKPQVIERNLFRPYWFLRRRQYETIVTSGFVHADLGHLAFVVFVSAVLPGPGIELRQSPAIWQNANPEAPKCRLRHA